MYSVFVETRDILQQFRMRGVLLSLGKGRVICSMWSNFCFAVTLDLIILFLQLCAKDLEDKSGVSQSCSVQRSLNLESGVGLVVPKAVHPCLCRQLSCVSILRSYKRSKQCKQLCTLSALPCESMIHTCAWEERQPTGRKKMAFLERKHSKHAVYN